MDVRSIAASFFMLTPLPTFAMQKTHTKSKINFLLILLLRSSVRGSFML